jgi:predicted O-methyltransferase YrrM
MEFLVVPMSEINPTTFFREDLPLGDYVSPGLKQVKLDPSFPNMVMGDTQVNTWKYLRSKVKHNWYVDTRFPYVGFVSRDEAHILYNSAIQFRGKRVLEIGCWFGWSAAHLVLADIKLDVIDPVLARQDFRVSVSQSLQSVINRFGLSSQVHLVAGSSPEIVHRIAANSTEPWSMFFIDGDHDAPAPRLDAQACMPYAAEDALVLFHDLASPDVSDGLDYFRDQGWNTMVYQTMQIMGVAWRGNAVPIAHIPDPSIEWELPEHLSSYQVSRG